MLSFIGFAIFGLIVGALARLILPGRQPMGMLMTAILGMIGSLAGGAINYALNGPPPEGTIQPAGFLMSLIGAIIVLAAYFGLAGRRETTV